jgi:hypothetical protein
VSLRKKTEMCGLDPCKRPSGKLVAHDDAERVLRKPTYVTKEEEEGCGVHVEMRHVAVVASCQEA